MRSFALRIQALPREERVFVSMIVLAMVLHALLLGIAQLLPSREAPAQISTLHFRIGDGGVIERPGLPAELSAPAEDKPAVQRKHKSPVAKKEAATTPKPKTPAKRVSITAPPAKAPEAEQRRVPAENVASLAAPEKEEKNSFGLPSLEQLFGEVENETAKSGGPSIGDLTEVNPKVGQGAGSASGAPAEETPQMREVRQRYTQKISGWSARQWYYPKEAAGRTGRVVVRVRIDRQGYVRFYSVDQTSGYEALDRAAIDMIRRANPMPSVPIDYPGGNLIEFLIPITFKP